jgi:hypothetical protein
MRAIEFLFQFQQQIFPLYRMCFGDSAEDAGYVVGVAEQGGVRVVAAIDPAAVADEGDSTWAGGAHKSWISAPTNAEATLREPCSWVGVGPSDSRRWALPPSGETGSVYAGMDLGDNGDEADSVSPWKFQSRLECAEESAGEVLAEPNSVAIIQQLDTRGKRPLPADDGPADSEQSTGKVNPEAPGWTKRLVSNFFLFYECIVLSCSLSAMNAGSSNSEIKNVVQFLFTCGMILGREARDSWECTILFKHQKKCRTSPYSTFVRLCFTQPQTLLWLCLPEAFGCIYF